MSKKRLPLEARLRTAIASELAKINKSSYPYLWEQTQTKAGYAKVEAQIVEMMIRTAVSYTHLDVYKRQFYGNAKKQQL